jgi:hypothetical protein
MGPSSTIWAMAGSCTWPTCGRPRPSKPVSLATQSNVPKGDYTDSADDDEAVLSQADVAVITASTIVNGTFAEVVRYADMARIRSTMDQAPGCYQTSFSTAASMWSFPASSAILRSLSEIWSTSWTAFSLCVFHGADGNL